MPWNPEQYQQDNKMPTQREYDKHNPEIKSDTSTFRLHFLNHIDQVRQCPMCGAIRIGVIALAIVGLYSLIF